jgi:signal transduction histidine kinase
VRPAPEGRGAAAPDAGLAGAVLEALPDAVRVTDRRNRLLFENRRARELFTPGRDAAGAARRRAGLNRSRLASFLASRTGAGREPGDLELVDPCSGDELAFTVAQAALDPSRGETAGTTWTLLRCTRVVPGPGRAAGPSGPEAELRALRAELERAHRHKSEFLASMSHELRTPIGAVLGYLALLREGIYGELSGRQEEVLGRVQHASEHLLELIDDVLDLARIEAGKLSISLGTVALPALLRGVVDSIEPLARARGLALSLDAPEDLPVLVTDATRVRQVLLNLLSNAVKFTPGGAISVVARPAGEREVEVAVADTGVGIEPAALAGIFDAFRQGDQSSTRRFEGTGLGLSIVRRLLGLLGGSIRVESTPGAGTVFTVTLPVRTPDVVDGHDAIRRARGARAVVVRDGDELAVPAEAPPAD